MTGGVELMGLQRRDIGWRVWKREGGFVGRKRRRVGGRSGRSGEVVERYEDVFRRMIRASL